MRILATILPKIKRKEKGSNETNDMWMLHLSSWVFGPYKCLVCGNVNHFCWSCGNRSSSDQTYSVLLQGKRAKCGQTVCKVQCTRWDQHAYSIALDKEERWQLRNANGNYEVQQSWKCFRLVANFCHDVVMPPKVWSSKGPYPPIIVLLWPLVASTVDLDWNVSICAFHAKLNTR